MYFLIYQLEGLLEKNPEIMSHLYRDIFEKEHLK